MTDRVEVTTPAALPDEGSAEMALRPSRLDDFVGQPQVRTSLQNTAQQVDNGRQKLANRRRQR